MTYQQHRVLREAVEEYTSAVDILRKAGMDVPEDVALWGEELRAMRVVVPVRCVVCKDSFKVVASVLVPITRSAFCSSCVREIEQMEI